MFRNEVYIAPYLNTETIDSSKVRVYGKPQKYFFSLNSLSGEAELQIFGDKVSRTVRSIVDIRLMGTIKENDAAYLYGVTPSPDEDKYCLGANYHVSKILPQNVKMAVYFERNSGDYE